MAHLLQPCVLGHLLYLRRLQHVYTFFDHVCSEICRIPTNVCSEIYGIYGICSMFILASTVCAQNLRNVRSYVIRAHTCIRPISAASVRASYSAACVRICRISYRMHVQGIHNTQRAHELMVCVLVNRQTSHTRLEGGKGWPHRELKPERRRGITALRTQQQHCCCEYW